MVEWLKTRSKLPLSPQIVPKTPKYTEETPDATSCNACNIKGFTLLGFGGEGSPPCVTNTISLTGSIFFLRLNRSQLSQSETQWAGMREYLAALT
jgi:hypothetical protein